MATAPSPNDLTRQQLDELDALLQRMLSLPLNPSDTATALAPPSAFTAPPLPDIPTPPAGKQWRVDPPAPVLNPVPHLAAPPVAAPPPTPEPRRAPEPPPAPEPPRLPVSWVPAPEPEPEPLPPPPIPISRPAPRPKAPPKPLPVVQPAAPAPRPAPRPTPHPIPDDVPAILWPIAALNAVAEALLGLFGPPGRFLRSGFGKNLLGLAGIGLLLYTAAHVAQARGWVSLPAPLPWPR
jgi:hypothetical protein